MSLKMDMKMDFVQGVSVLLFQDFNEKSYLEMLDSVLEVEIIKKYFFGEARRMPIQKSRFIQVTVPEDDTGISFDSALAETKRYLHDAEVSHKENCQDTSNYLPQMLRALECLIQYLGWSGSYNAAERAERMMRHYAPSRMQMKVLS